jgi:hypothetical protein
MSPADLYSLYLIAHGTNDKLAAHSLLPVHIGQNWLDDYKCSGPFQRLTFENSPFSFVLFLKLVHTMSYFLTGKAGALPILIIKREKIETEWSFVWKISFSFINTKKTR